MVPFYFKMKIEIHYIRGMKKLFLLPFLICALSAMAQIDTAYLPPFAFMTYDTQEWDMEENETDENASIRLRGKIDKGFELKIRLNIGDTLITKENLLAKLESRNPYGRQMVIENLNDMGEYFIGVFSFSQDECSRNDIPVMLKSAKFRAAFRIINNTNLLTIEIDDDSFFFPEDTQTQNIVNATNSIHISTPKEIDNLLGLPMSNQKVEILLQEMYNKRYKESFDFNLSKRKCFDDSYFMEELNNYFSYAEIDSLLNYASDSVLCDLVAQHQAQEEIFFEESKLRSKADIGFNYAERTELLQKARKEEFSLEEYLDFQLSEQQDGPIQRLKYYSNTDLDYNDNDKYQDIIQKLFSDKYLHGEVIQQLHFESFGDHKYLLRILHTNQDTIITNSFYHLQKRKNTYDVNKLTLPKELLEKYENTPIQDKPLDASYFIDDSNYFPGPELIPMGLNVFSSPKNQLILIYDATLNSSNFPTHVNIGNSKDIKWIPTVPVDIDSTKFLIAKRKSLSDLDQYFSEYSSLHWEEFEIASEKNRINSFFEMKYNMSIDSALALNNSPTKEYGEDYMVAYYEIRSFIELNTLAPYIVKSEEGVGDINKDGLEDLYSILISNGKIIDAKAYLFYENSYEIIGKKEVIKLLKDNTGFKNLLLKSQIANHGEKMMEVEPDLFNILQD